MFNWFSLSPSFLFESLYIVLNLYLLWPFPKLMVLMWITSGYNIGLNLACIELKFNGK